MSVAEAWEQLSILENQYADLLINEASMRELNDLWNEIARLRAFVEQ
ncbi:hypothetical protein [Flaviaesturariibacter amylovorans]|uniref:Peptide chain release factor 2 n=1 Tax=Flaviaesturariibacter amylovorans TaxID=1084520 RepID=A0ABP8H4J5_9BACT